MFLFFHATSLSKHWKCVGLIINEYLVHAAFYAIKIKISSMQYADHELATVISERNLYWVFTF